MWKRRYHSSNDSILFAHIACLLLGIGMVIWGAAPAVIHWLVTRQLPGVDVLMLHGTNLLLGLAFIGLHVLLRQRVRWAAWVTFLTSATLASTVLVLIRITGLHPASSFLLLASSATCFASWLAITALARLARPKSRPSYMPSDARSRMFLELDSPGQSPPDESQLQLVPRASVDRTASDRLH